MVKEILGTVCTQLQGKYGDPGFAFCKHQIETYEPQCALHNPIMAVSCGLIDNILAMTKHILTIIT